MTRSRCAAAVIVVPAVLALGGCAGGAGAGERATTDPAEATEIAAWSVPAGIAPELVYVTEVEGFTLATQSVGVSGDDGMSAAYVGGDGGTVTLTTSREPVPSVDLCTDLAGSATLRCAVERGEVQVVLEGSDVDPATLRAAAEAVRVPGAGELVPLFGDLPKLRKPVERGDLPPHGDGAPLDPPVPGG